MSEPYIIENHEHWHLVAVERAGEFHREGTYKHYCSNCGRYYTAHFRGASGCPNRIEIKETNEQQTGKTSERD